MLEPIVISLAFIGIGGFVAYSGYKKIQTNRSYQAADFLNGKKAPIDEPVKVKGTIKETQESVEGLVTGEEKAFVNYKVEYHQSDGDTQGSDWHTLEQGNEGGPLVLDTDSGELLIDPTETANVYFSDEKNYETRIDHKRLIRDDPEISPHMEAFLERNGLTTDEGGIFQHDKNDYRRYTEESIETGDTMVAFGKTEQVTSKDYEGDAFNSPAAKIAAGPADESMVLVDQEDIPFWDRIGPYALLLVGGLFVLIGSGLLAGTVL